MKKILTILVLLVATAASAQYRPYPHHGHGGGYGWGWVAPAVLGGAVVYAATRPQVVVQQPPVFVQQPPVVMQQPVVIQQAPVPPATVYYGQSQQCTVWTEVQNFDGTITRTRTCSQ